MPVSFRLLIVCGALGLGLACAGTPEDHVKRADDYAAQNNYSDAMVEYRAALQRNAQLGTARLALADLHAELGDVPNAYREYIRAADTLPDNVDAQLKAGAMLLMRNRLAEAKTRAESAIATLKGALALSPSFEGADEARRVIGELSIP